jgi:glutamyl-tRNA reductase
VTERLLLVGVSQRTAPISLRDRLALAAEDFVTDGELVVLSTCNRLELYAAVEDVDAAERRLVSELARRAGVLERELAAAATVAADDDAVLHLCRVAAGLDSAILGEPQILGQVRRAAASRSSGLLLDRLFACAVRAGRRARNETGLGERPGSLAAVAANVAGEVLGDLAGRRVLVVGAGAMAELVAACFRARGAQIVVASRTRDRADALAARVAGRAAPFEALAKELAAADVLVTCTRCPHVVVTADEVAAAGPLLVVDLALPRDVDPAVAALDGCRLYDLDTLPVSSRAGADVDAAEQIVAEEAARFVAWRRSRSAVAAIASLRSLAETIRADELARMQTKLGGLSPEQRRAVETVTAQILNKLLHEPTVRVKESAGAQLVPALCHLFALEDAA